MQQGFEITKERFHLYDHRIYYIWGIWPEGCIPQVLLDNKEIGVVWEEQKQTVLPVLDKDEDGRNGVMVKMELHLPEEWRLCHCLSIYAMEQGKKKKWHSIKVKQLKKRQGGIQYFVDSASLNQEERVCTIRGWMLAEEKVSVSVYDEQHNCLPFEMKRTGRSDVNAQYQELQQDVDAGFYMDVQIGTAAALYLVFSTSTEKTEKKISVGKLALFWEKVRKYSLKGFSYLRLYGIRGLVKKIIKKVQNEHKKPQPYEEWIKKHLPNDSEQQAQRAKKFTHDIKFSIVVPLYKTPEKYLMSLVESLKKQTYSNWELCLSDGSGEDSPLRELLKKIQAEESRVKVVSSEQQLRIAENTNAAIKIATGDFIAFADHDDELTPNALYECAVALEKKPDIDVLYSDEDKMSMHGKRYFEPHFKPDFNIDLLCTVNYICHLFVVKRALLEQTGGLRAEFDGAQDHDFIFRCIEKADHIYHIPKILYHWRCHEDSTSENPQSKLYAFEAGVRAVQAHYDRIHVPAEVYQGEYLGLYRTRFLRNEDPLISIIIPNKDHIEDLKRCIDSIEKKSAYQNYEYIIVENNSTEEETFQFYKELERKNKKVQVVKWDGPFNYSAINNYGVQFASGSYYLLLNNDTEMIRGDCLEELLGYCMRKDVGAVGARLYYDDDTIQHAGVVIGFGGIAGHCFVQQPRGFTGYCHRIICAQDYSAVTAACMMVRKEVFDEVGGLSEAFAVAFNDIDFCMKIRQAGYQIVYNPYAELYHYESKSRGQEDTPEKIARFQKEIATFASRWPDILRNGDPFYNPNLTLDSQDFSLKRLK